MARLPRLSIAGLPHHVVQRCLPGRRLWDDADQAGILLADLRAGCAVHAIALHAYALLPDHLHLLLTAPDAEGPGRLLQYLGRRAIRRCNQREGRTGPLWAGRFRATVIDAPDWLIDTMHLVECSAAHGQAPGPSALGACSSLAHHLGLRSDPWLSDHPVFWALGNTPFERQARYGQIVAQELAPERRARILDATLHGWPLGDAAFVDELAARTGRRLVRLRPGRPRRAPAPDAARVAPR